MEAGFERQVEMVQGLLGEFMPKLVKQPCEGNLEDLNGIVGIFEDLLGGLRMDGAENRDWNEERIGILEGQ